MSRSVVAASRVNALLRYLRDEIELRVDVLDMYDEIYDYKMSCGCDIHLTFGIGKVNRFAAWRTGERTPTYAEIERNPCEVHANDSGWDNRVNWNGTFMAWSHDPKRKDEFNLED